MVKNDELRNAWDFVEHTGISIFLTGKAGTGKTTFLRAVKENSTKRIVVVAPTGVAAVNAGGVTIHSFFQLPLSPFVPEVQIQTRFAFGKEKRKIMRTLDLLIIDEISMVRVDVLDAIDSVLRRYREHHKPFGGVQLLMIGDLQQLTPVVRPDEEALLRKYYDTPYFFSSHALRSIDYVTIELSKVFRQQDDTFITILNHIRDGQATTADLQLLNQRFLPHFQPTVESDYIRLTTHNRMADDFNRRQMISLDEPEFTFVAEIGGQFPDNNYPADYKLTLKRGAQVMFIHNDAGGKFYNGRIGHVISIDRNHIHVLCPGDEIPIEVPMNTWENAKYTLNEQTKQIESEVQGTFTQYPLRLAWAITIHKSQGLTFDHAIIEAQQAFASGQVYVALSRCRTLEGLVLASPIAQSAVINDQRVSDYISTQTELANKSIANLSQLKEAYYRFLLLELFSFMDIVSDETVLFRVVSEFYYKYQKVHALHKMTLADLDKRIVAVAQKWQLVINGMANEELHSDASQERIKRSALYFHSQLTELFERLIATTKPLESNNKTGVRRFQNAIADLEQSYRLKKLTLEDIMHNGFSTNIYLKAKQEAILSGMPDDDEKPRRRMKRKAKEAKAPKEKTDVVTFKLFKMGMTIDEIAKKRGLTAATISGHLSRYVATRELKLDDVLGNQKANYLRRIIKAVGPSSGLTAIKSICKDDISYSDIRLALAEKR